MKRRISYPRGLTGIAIRPRAGFAVDRAVPREDAALSPRSLFAKPPRLFRLDALGVAEAGPVLDLAFELCMHRRAGDDVRRDVELGEAPDNLRVGHDFRD